MGGDERLEAYARLIVGIGVNLQPGQDVQISGFIEHAPLIRVLTRIAYEAGARYVDVLYQDNHVRKALVELGPEESLSWTPPYWITRLEDLVERRGARIAITGEADPALLAGLDQRRVGAARMTEYNDLMLRAVTERRVSWVVAAYPNEGWAEAVFGEPDVERLWDAVACAVRLDEPDPVEAWRRHVDRLSGRARLLTARRFDALRFHGSGTDFTVGLLPGSLWESAETETEWGLRHVPNLPTEEVFTSPDPRRAGRRGARLGRRGRGARPAPARRGREPARRGGARRRLVGGRPHRDHLPQHALRRERRLARRLRHRLPRPRRGRGGREPLDRAHRRDDRRLRARGGRHRAPRETCPDLAGRRVGACLAAGESGPSCGSS